MTKVTIIKYPFTFLGWFGPLHWALKFVDNADTDRPHIYYNQRTRDAVEALTEDQFLEQLNRDTGSTDNFIESGTMSFEGKADMIRTWDQEMKKPYNLFTNNCEHFCNKMLGRKEEGSSQVLVGLALTAIASYLMLK